MSGPDIESPCVKLCRMHPRTGLCEGCFRNIDEIARWSRLDNEQKRIILERVCERRLAAAAADSD